MNNDYTETSIILFLIVAVAIMVLQQYFAEAFIMVWKWIAMGLLFPAAILPSFVTEHGIFFWMADVKETSHTIISMLVQSTSYIYAQGGELEFVGKVNRYLTTMYSPFILAFFLFYLKKNLSKREFRRNFSIDSLIEDQADLWPVIKPMVEVKPQDTKDLDTGEWAMCLEPIQFGYKNNLVIETENKMGEKKIALDEEKSLKLFKTQLGRQWKGVEDLTREERFVLSVLLTKANRFGKDAVVLVGTIATAYSSEKKYSKKQMDLFMKEADAAADAAIEKYKKSEVFLNILSQHYYVNTVLPRMLEMARVDGVLATADFIWLKPRNRTLWYILNNVGRTASWTECAGIWFHYNYEKAIERKLPAPKISGALAALDLDFKESAEEYIPLKGYNDMEK